MPFRDPDEALRQRVAQLEEELHSQGRAIDALKQERGELHERLGRALELLDDLSDEPVKPAEAPKVAEVKEVIAEAKEKLPSPTAEAAPAPSPPAAPDAPERPRRHGRFVVFLAAAVVTCGLLYQKYGPKPVATLELGRARLEQPLDVVKAALGEGAQDANGNLTLRTLVAGEPATCTYSFLFDSPILSAISCSISQMPTPEENDALIDRVIDAFEERLGWADSADEDDYGSWRRVGYRWLGGGAVFELSLQSPNTFYATLKLEDHDDIVQRDAAKRAADYAREQAEKQRQEREEERRRLQGQ